MNFKRAISDNQQRFQCQTALVDKHRQPEQVQPVQFLCCADAQGVSFQMPSFISGDNDQRKSFMNFNSDMSPEIQSDPEKGEDGR